MKKKKIGSKAWFMGGRGTPVRVRSRMSGISGVAYINDPQVWVEGNGIAGWYRREVLLRDFLISTGKRALAGK